MGIAKKTRKFGHVKKIISQKDNRLKQNQAKAEEKKAKADNVVREIPQAPSALFFQFNTSLAPPYSILVDTNFLSHTVQHKLDVIPTELEKLGPKYRLALRIAKDPRFERLKCDHTGTYADDCIVDRVIKHRIYIVATNDRDLKRRIRKIPGVPVMSVARAKYVIERLPDAPEK
ncbi:TPA_exp: hypothetical protein A8136_5682 [Trichophyton benhamiae CBS 112371]|nr:TPA_exp: hypothetical protein A8136_5682 [Trichophyton benhamiae CBS 112371]